MRPARRMSQAAALAAVVLLVGPAAAQVGGRLPVGGAIYQGGGISSGRGVSSGGGVSAGGGLGQVRGLTTGPILPTARLQPGLGTLPGVGGFGYYPGVVGYYPGVGRGLFYPGGTYLPGVTGYGTAYPGLTTDPFAGPAPAFGPAQAYTAPQMPIYGNTPAYGTTPAYGGTPAYGTTPVYGNPPAYGGPPSTGILGGGVYQPYGTFGNVTVPFGLAVPLASSAAVPRAEAEPSYAGMTPTYDGPAGMTPTYLERLAQTGSGLGPVVSRTAADPGWGHIEAPAHIQVVVPADAQVWFGDRLTLQTGTLRKFNTPPLPPGKEFYYNLRVKWVQDGQEVERAGRIGVSAGATRAVDLTTPPPTEVPPE